MRFFRILDAFSSPARWYLGGPMSDAAKDVDPRSFTAGCRYEGAKSLVVPVESGSEPLDFTLASFDMPVVTARIAASLGILAPGEIQRIPVKVGALRRRYEVINVLTILNAINEDRSEITRWTEADGVPGKTGSYAGIGKLVLNRTALGASKIFRLKNWELPLIVSDVIKNALQKAHTTGIAFPPPLWPRQTLPTPLRNASPLAARQSLPTIPSGIPSGHQPRRSLLNSSRGSSCRRASMPAAKSCRPAGSSFSRDHSPNNRSTPSHFGCRDGLSR